MVAAVPRVTLAQDRLGPVIALITSLAQGDLHPDLPVIDGDPELEAVVLGLQMLAEELAATRTAMSERTTELEALNNGLTLLNVSSFWQDVTRGVVLLLAVSLDQVRVRLQEK